MAKKKKEEPKEQEQQTSTSSAESQDQPLGPSPQEKKSGKGGSILPWIITGAVVLLCAGAGLGLGRLFAKGNAPAEQTTEEGQTPLAQQPQTSQRTAEGENVWYFDLEPLVANLDEPSVTRYVRATLTLEISTELDAKQGMALLEQKRPLLINWLTIYLSSLSLEEARGDRNLKRIQTDVRDAFNEKLFGELKPPIKRILFKEFAIQ